MLRFINSFAIIFLYPKSSMIMLIFGYEELHVELSSSKVILICGYEGHSKNVTDSNLIRYMKYVYLHRYIQAFNCLLDFHPYL